MQIRIGFDIITEQTAPAPTVALLSVHPDAASRLHAPEILHADPPIPIAEYRDGFGNRCHRFTAPVGPLRLWTESVVEDSGEPDPQVTGAIQHPVEDLPDEVLQFLLPSRYCEVDLLGDFAWEQFGNTNPGWERVQAISDFTHSHVKYGYEFAHPTKTANDIFEQGGGVCRDFQHLAVTLCRCMNIPARYVSGYLGDIRCVPIPGPMDFHAWFEAYLGGQWHTFDARHNVPRVGRVLMSRGRDAADVALTTTFGLSKLMKFEVTAEEIAGKG